MIKIINNIQDTSESENFDSKCRIVEHLIRALSAESNSSEMSDEKYKYVVLITADKEEYPIKVKISENGNLDRNSCNEVEELLDTFNVYFNENENISKFIKVFKSSETLKRDKRIRRNVNCKKNNIHMRQTEGMSFLGLSMSPSSGSVASFMLEQKKGC